MSGDEEERKSIQQTSQMFAAQITQLLFKVPRVLLLLLKTNDCLRSVDLALGEVRAVAHLLFCCVMNNNNSNSRAFQLIVCARYRCVMNVPGKQRCIRQALLSASMY